MDGIRSREKRSEKVSVERPTDPFCQFPPAEGKTDLTKTGLNPPKKFTVSGKTQLKILFRLVDTNC